jgi:hypothetical protein
MFGFVFAVLLWRSAGRRRHEAALDRVVVAPNLPQEA